MKVLGGWGTVNMVSSAIGIALEDDEQRKNFHIMNIGWNAVNVLIALPELLRKSPNAPTSDLQLMRYQNKLGKILLFNAGLDVAYITGGLLVRHLQYSNPSDAAKWRGLGNGLIYNGVFLLLFDTALYSINNRSDKKYFKAKGITFNLQPTGLGISAAL